MLARASVLADSVEGRTRLPVLHSEPPLTWRDTPGALHLVGSGAGPVGGDDLRLDVAVRAGAELTVRSAAASMVHPGPTGEPSLLSATVEVGRDAVLRWLVEPVILVQGCDHHSRTRVRVAAGGTLIWREELALGRHGEPSGSMLQRLAVDLDGRPLVRNDLAVGPAWPGSLGPAGVGSARAVGSLLVVGPLAAKVEGAAGAHPDPAPDFELQVAALPFEGPAVLVSAVAERAADLSSLFTRLVDDL